MQIHQVGNLAHVRRECSRRAYLRRNRWVSFASIAVHS
jgi:hypothetical protein